MKTFVLQRDQDESGVSGTGPVGEVVEFPNGQAVLQWSEQTVAGVPSLSIFPSLGDLEKVHGHDGKTRLVPTGQAGNGQTPSTEFSETDEVLEFSDGGLEEGFSEGTFAEGEHAIPYLDVPARLFTAGTHRGKLYTKQDLKDLASTFRPPQTDLSDWDVPVQLDHSDSARDTMGHLRSVFVRGDKDLMGVLRFVGQEAIQPVRERRYRKLSVGIRLTNPKRLKEVSVTPYPQVLGAALNFNEEADAMKTGTEAEKPVTQPEVKPVETPATETKMAEAPKPEVKTVTPPAPEKPAPVALMSEELKAEVARQLAEAEAKFNERTAALEAKHNEREAKLVAQEQVARFKELTALVDSFSEEGAAKSVPAMREKELALVKTFSEEQLALYKEVKSLQPPVINYGVLGVQESKMTADENADQLAERWMAKSGKKTESK